MTFNLELEQEADGRWVAELVGHGIVVYGASAEEATDKATRVLEEYIGDTVEGMAWDIAEGKLMKIERPTAQEITDRIFDGFPPPVWILKSRVPKTVPVSYFTSTLELYNHLRTYYCADVTHNPRSNTHD